MLHIEGLHVRLGTREILSGIDLRIRPGETVVLFGPNGSGKTSLLMAIMGHPQYRVTQGRILYGDRDITGLPMDERARLGIGLAYQRPPAIHGLKTRQLVQLCAGQRGSPEALAARLKLLPLLERDFNVGFSGGETKRLELLQLLALWPHLLLFDEPESGVDLESIALVGATLRDLLAQNGGVGACRGERTGEAPMGLIITHTGFILDYVHADRAMVLFEGRLACQGSPSRILHTISAKGYEECVRCLS